MEASRHSQKTMRGSRRPTETVEDLRRRFATQDITERSPGSLGSEISLRANAFRVKVSDGAVIHRHSIKVIPVPEKESSGLLEDIIDHLRDCQELQKYESRVAFDGGRELYVIGEPLPAGLSVSIILPDAYGVSQEYILSFPKHKALDVKDISRLIQNKDSGASLKPFITALNVAFRVSVSSAVHRSGNGAFSYPPSAFSPPDSAIHCNPSVEAWKSFLTSIRPVLDGLVLNVQSCLRAFYVPRVQLSELMIELKRKSHGVDPDWQSLFGRLEVTKTIGPKRKSSIKSFGPGTARSTIINIEKYGAVNLEQYYFKEFGTRLRHADDLPVINIGRGKDVFVPAEACAIDSNRVGNAPPVAFTTDGERVMSRYGTLSPDAVAQIITRQTHNLFNLNDLAPLLKVLGIEISQNLVQTKGRVLDPPLVSYPSGNPSISNGIWINNNARFSQPVDLNNCFVISINTGSPDDFLDLGNATFRNAVIAIRDACLARGLNIDPEAIPRAAVVDFEQVDLQNLSSSTRYKKLTMEKIGDTIKDLRNSRRTPVIFFFLSGHQEHLYPELKRLLDVEVGIPSMVILTRHARQAVAQGNAARSRFYVALAQKINAKLGGINHRIERKGLKLLDGTMLVGLSISSSGALPTITSVAASCDDTFGRYPVSIRVQQGKDNTIQDVKAMIIERLQEYEGRMSSLPKRIVIFRVGASDGDFESILLKETPLISEAFEAFKKGYKPSLTVILCGRGHDIRFFASGAGNFDNPKAGTVVDQGITPLTAGFDFYLQAHAGDKGSTVRSTRYSVILDENKFTADDLQNGIYNLSYLWEPSPRSVNLAPPARWAARASHHAKAYLHSLACAANDNTKKTRELRALTAESAKGFVHKDLKSTMFYM